jgi:hypothetical protein
LYFALQPAKQTNDGPNNEPISLNEKTQVM